MYSCVHRYNCSLPWCTIRTAELAVGVTTKHNFPERYLDLGLLISSTSTEPNLRYKSLIWISSLILIMKALRLTVIWCLDQVSNIRQDNFNVYISLHKTFSIKLNLSTYSDENCSEIKLCFTCSTKIIKGGVVKGKGATTVQKCGRSRVARFMANAKREPNKILGPTAKFLVRGSRVKPFEADAIL